MRLRQLLFVLLLALLTVPVTAEDFAPVTELGISAEHIGAGNIDGFSRGASSVFDNPAGLYRVDGNSLSLFNATVLEDTQYFNLAYSRAFDWGTIGIGYMQSEVNDNFITTENNTGEHEIVDSFIARNSVLEMGYQKSIRPGLHLGSSFNIYRRDLYQSSAIGYNFDIGLIWEKDNYTITGALNNILINKRVEYSTGGHETLPFQAVVSGKYDFSSHVSVLGEYTYEKKRSLYAFAASLTPKWWTNITIVGGYKQAFVRNEKKSRLTLGAGLLLGSIEIFSAYERSEHVQDRDFYYVSTNLYF